MLHKNEEEKNMEKEKKQQPQQYTRTIEFNKRKTIDYNMRLFLFFIHFSYRCHNGFPYCCGNCVLFQAKCKKKPEKKCNKLSRCADKLSVI